jgi:outer membrane protein
MNNYSFLLRSALAVAGVLVGCRSVRAETLQDALSAAYRTNPVLRGQQATQRAMDETYVQARAGWRPTVSITATGEYVHEPNSIVQYQQGAFDSNDNEAALTVKQPIYTGGRVANAVRAADARVRAGQQSLRLVEAQTFQAVITAYMDVLRDQDILEVRRADLATLQRQVKESQARYKLGAQITRTDVAQAEGQQQQAEAALAAAQAQLAASRGAYIAAVGAPPGKLEQPETLPDCPKNFDDAVAQAEAANPALAQNLFLADASKADIDTARSGRYPTIGVEGSVGTIGPLSPLHTRAYEPEALALVTITQPLIAGGLIASQVRQAKDRHEADEQAVEAAGRQALENVITSWNQASAGQAQIRANEAQVQSAATALKGYQLEYGYGLRSTLDVLIADENLRAAQVALAQSRHDTIVAQAALLAATGGLEARHMLPNAPLYDAQAAFRRVKNAGAVPWEGAIKALDRGG